MKKDEHLKIMKNYSWRSMFFSYFFLLVIMFLILTSVLLMCFRVINNKTSDKIIRNSVNQSFYKINMTVNQIFNEINKTYTIYSSNSNFKSYLLADDVSDVNVNDVNETMNGYLRTGEYLDSIYIYSRKSDYVLSTESSSYFDNFYNKDWFYKFEKANKYFYAIPENNVGGRNIITCMYDMSVNSFGFSDGIFVANIDTNKMEHLIFDKNTMLSEVVYLVNDEGTVIYSNERGIVGKNVSELPYETEQAYGSDIVLKRKNNYINCSVLLDNGVQLHSAVDLSAYSVDMSYEKGMFLFAICLAVILTLLLSLYSSVNFYKSLTKIIINIENPMEISAENNYSENEISYISNSILSTIKNNRAMEEQMVEKVKSLKKMQTIALQTQLNPHFLFNTLNLVNIIVMRITKGENDASRVIKLLCDLMYVSLDTKKTLITVDEEIKYTKEYLEIEMIKNKNRFEINWNVAPGLLNIQIIKFVLQPIVENAIEHGFKRSGNKICRIDINVFSNNGMLNFVVCDNGSGISAEKLAEITEQLNSEEIRETKHIGISNVNQRLKLFYGNKYGISINSDKSGTEVSITLPINEEDEKTEKSTE